MEVYGELISNGLPFVDFYSEVIFDIVLLGCWLRCKTNDQRHIMKGRL